MKCPHCQTQFHDKKEQIKLGYDRDAFWQIDKQTCPACYRFVLHVVSHHFDKNRHGISQGNKSGRYLARPRTALRAHPPQQVPSDIFPRIISKRRLILADSPKASAALSRRCLQHILREKAGVKHSNLEKEIEAVLASKQLPSFLANAIDAVRHIGNFAAHPIKTTSTGEIVPVEPGEAEWTLDVLDGLFDFYFVQPMILQQRRDALDAKLALAGKPPTKV